MNNNQLDEERGGMILATLVVLSAVFIIGVAIGKWVLQ